MSWLSNTWKRVTANPAKTVADIGTLGFTVALRALPKSVGGGESGFFSKSAEVVGATEIGVGVGFATGGFPGAVTGGASGFGRGVSGVLNNNSGKDIAGGAAKWSAVTGSFTGAVQGTGAAGFVRNQIFTGASKIPALPKITFPKFTAAGVTSLAALATAFKPAFAPGTSNVNLTPPAIPNETTPPPFPSSINVGNPSAVPSGSPGPGSTIAIIPSSSQGAPFPWWILVAAGAVFYYFLKKKRHHERA